jgi:hypothetical protein
MEFRVRIQRPSSLEQLRPIVPEAHEWRVLDGHIGQERRDQLNSLIGRSRVDDQRVINIGFQGAKTSPKYMGFVLDDHRQTDGIFHCGSGG